MDGATPSTLLAWIQVGTSFALILLGGWVIWRTRTRHLLIRRLWHLIHGSQEIADPQVKAYVEDEGSLAAFHMFAGVGVRNLKEAHDLLRWTQANDVTMRSLRLCGDYFDIERRQVRADRLPGRWRHKSRAVVAILSWFLFGLSLWAMSVDYVLVTLKSTQTTFFLSSNSARVLWPPWPLDPGVVSKDLCDRTQPAEVAAQSGFQPRDAESVCAVLRDEATPAFTKKSLAGQRWALAWLALLFAYWCLGSILAWLSAEAAITLANRRVDPRLDHGQLPLDLWPNAAPAQ